MDTKTIRTSDDVYERLKSRKRPDESSSDLLDRFTDRQTQFNRGFGALEAVDFEPALAVVDDRFGRAVRPDR